MPERPGTPQPGAVLGCHRKFRADLLNQVVGHAGQPGLVGKRAHARLVMVAGRSQVSYDFNMAGLAEIEILHTQHFDQIDLEQVVRLVSRGDIQIRPLLREVVPFDDAIRIYDTLRRQSCPVTGHGLCYGRSIAAPFHEYLELESLYDCTDRREENGSG